MNWYLIIDKYENWYLLKTHYIIKNTKIATVIAQQQGIISLYNYVVRVFPLTPIEYLNFLIKGASIYQLVCMK